MAKRSQDREQPEWGLYCCNDCGRVLELDNVLSADVDRRDGVATGYIRFVHFCVCDGGVVHESRRWGSYPSFLALFGVMPPLPYQSPFQRQCIPEDDITVARWAWELAQVADWDDFMLFAEDAADRKAA